ncbi:MAG: hypothetical protein IJ840_05320, partial [Bacteroidales bacterium]|nr:hypothetical protein [Bacteroidales bacterium]
MTPFLRQVADHYMAAGDISSRCLIFPNRRSQVFFRKYLGEAVAAKGSPIIAPELLTINDFFYKISGSAASDRISLLLELYDCYKSLNPAAEPLDEFIFWGDVILGDFDDVDKYRVDPKRLFTNIKEFREIQDSFSYLSQTQREAMERFVRHFRVPAAGAGQGKREMKDRFLQVWNILLPLYESFRSALSGKGMSYEGMTYRSMVERLETEPVTDVLARAFPNVKEFVFVGLNALNECERAVARKMRNAGAGAFVWDFQGGLLRDPMNNASLFMSRNISEFGQAFQLGDEDIRTPEVEVVSVPSSTGQAKLLPSILKDDSYAVILPDESLLIPVLNSIPPEIKDVNVTMGYPMRGSAFFDFISLLLTMRNRLREKDGKWYFYHSHVWAVFSSGLFKKVAAGDQRTNDIVEAVKKEAKYYIPEEDLSGTGLMDLIFKPVLSDHSHTGYLKDVIRGIASLMATDPDMAIELEFARKAYNAINQLESKKLDILPATFSKLVRELLSPMSVPFNGEPLKGLQIMGPLETRALDFKHIVILSCNEGVFPRRGVSSSFIPPELRKGFGLPTYEHQDAIWSYYFYRMIQRAETVTLMYDSRTEGLKNGEESRFIKQLEYHFNLPVKRSVLKSGASVHDPSGSIPKTDGHVSKVRDTVLSASSLKDYLDCPAKFYFSKVEGLKEET